jgi:hypothetical protein
MRNDDIIYLRPMKVALPSKTCAKIKLRGCVNFYCISGKVGVYPTANIKFKKLRVEGRGAISASQIYESDQSASQMHARSIDRSASSQF